MKIYFLRHATASDVARNDEERELTGEGFQEARRVGRFLKQLEVIPDLVMSSPLVRAQQTAAAVAEALGHKGKIQTAAELGNEAPMEEFLRFLERQQSGRSILLVGHSPSMPARISVLLGSACEECLDMGKASIACLALRHCGPGGGVLRWFMRQKQIKRLAG
jgi:phosphohistidine phosphatase